MKHARWFIRLIYSLSLFSIASYFYSSEVVSSPLIVPAPQGGGVSLILENDRLNILHNAVVHILLPLTIQVHNTIKCE